MKTKPKFLWRENYIDYLWAKETTGKHYFFAEGYLIYNRGVLSAYATNKEIKETTVIANNFLKNLSLLLNLEKEIIEVKKEINLFDADFTKLKLKKLDNKKLFQLYISFINLYGKYINLYRFTEPHLVKKIEDKANRIVSNITSKKSSKVLLSEILSSPKEKIKEYGLLENKDIFELVLSISKIRFEAKKITDILAEDTELLLMETARRTNYAVSQISNMSLEELESLLLENKQIDTYKPNKRTNQFGLFISIKNEKVTIKDLSKEDIKLIEKEENKNKKIIKGDVAYPGKVKGVARVASLLFDKKDFQKFISSLKENEILVAPMTSPNLTTAFSKVKGVITDEGGLMSHAALISREKRVPCIVGTKTATKVLKDGDKVIMDADNGTVKKII